MGISVCILLPYFKSPPLNSELIKIINNANENKIKHGKQDNSQNLFYALIGFNAPREQNIIEFAHHRINLNVPTGTQLLNPTKAIAELCQNGMRDCMSDYDRFPSAIKDMIRDNEYLLERYLSLINYPVYSEITNSADEPIAPPFKSLKLINRLFHAYASFTYKKQPENGLKLLENDISILRKMLSQANTFSMKLNALNLLYGDLMLFEQWLDGSFSDPSTLINFNPNLLKSLSPEEKSIKKQLKSDLIRKHYFFLSLEHCKFNSLYTLKCQQPDTQHPKNPFNRLIFNANETSNLAFQDYQKHLSLNLLSIKELKEAFLLKNQQEDREQHFFEYNQIGRALARLVDSSPLNYLAVLSDIDGMLNLVQIKHYIIANNLTDSSIPKILEKFPGNLSWQQQNRVIYFESLSKTIKTKIIFRQQESPVPQ